MSSKVPVEIKMLSFPLPSFLLQYWRFHYFPVLEPLGGDEQAPNSHCVYGDPAFDMVMAMSTEDIGNIVGKNLLPQYTYARIYKNGSDLKIHSDRPECQYSVTLCLGGEYEKPWPIWIKDYAGMKNPGPEDVKELMDRFGHKGKIELISGDSTKTVPNYFNANPDKYFDLITVDGDHRIKGAKKDLKNIMPRLKIGGFLVFDDI